MQDYYNKEQYQNKISPSASEYVSSHKQREFRSYESYYSDPSQSQIETRKVDGHPGKQSNHKHEEVSCEYYRDTSGFPSRNKSNRDRDFIRYTFSGEKMWNRSSNSGRGQHRLQKEETSNLSFENNTSSRHQVADIFRKKHDQNEAYGRKNNESRADQLKGDIRSQLSQRSHSPSSPVTMIEHNRNSFDSEKILTVFSLSGVFNSFTDDIDQPDKCQGFEVVTPVRKSRSAELCDEIVDKKPNQMILRHKQNCSGVNLTSSLVTPLRSQIKPEPIQIYFILKEHKQAFSNFSYLLPGLKESSELGDSTNRGQTENEEGMGEGEYNKFDVNPYVKTRRVERDIVIARRRLEAAVCAFGGTITHKTLEAKCNNLSTIFRPKRNREEAVSEVNVSNKRAKYEQDMKIRYFDNENRLSWDVEENPPIETSSEDDSPGDKNDLNSTPSGSDNLEKVPQSADSQEQSKVTNDASEIIKTTITDSAVIHTMETESKGDELIDNSSSTITEGVSSSKAKYRCKLCGQLKQNHSCPYQQSLQRSIGTMSFPSLNAFGASEPGMLAPALSEMNNSAVTDDDQSMASPSRTKSDTESNLNTELHEVSGNYQGMFHGIRDSSNIFRIPSRYESREEVLLSDTVSSFKGERRRLLIHSSLRNEGQSDITNDALVSDAAELKADQFKPVKIVDSTCGDYNYPVLPLTYGQRMTMSDNLFSLSKEVPALTDECAKVLCEAREKDCWDLAVAELMTQVLVILYCPASDYRMEGLRRYLIGLGISC